MSSSTGKLCFVAPLAALAAAAGAALAAPPAGSDRPVVKAKADAPAEVKASSWGFDPVDSTASLQAAINSGARRVLVENMGSPWIVTPISVAGDQEIVFEEGAVVEAKRGEFRGRNDSLFQVVLKKNVSLIGYGVVLRMHKKDYDNAPYDKAEWRHVIDIKSSENVRVYGLTLAESGGDGIYLGAAQKGVPNKDIHIKDVVCDRNYRQGISVITAENLLIEDTVLKNTSGTPPQAGIDFEPNNASERLVNCVMRNCVSENNAGCGYVFYLPHLTAESAPVSIRFENCVARGSNRLAFSFTMGSGGATAAAAGVAEFTDCTFSGGVGPAVTIRRKPASACRLRFVRCRMRNPAPENHEAPAILFDTRQGDTEDVGGVLFEDCVLEDTVERPIMQYVDREGGLRLVDVTGSLRVRRGGSETVHAFTKKWLDGLHTGHVYKRFPKYDVRGVQWAPVAGESPALNRKLRPISVRRSGVFVLYARRGDEAAFSLRQLQVGRYSGRPMPVTVVSPSGKKLVVGRVGFNAEQAFQFTADETGVYRIPFDCGANKMQMTSANRPACVSGEAGRIQLIGATGDFYFYVPAGVEEFGLKISGEGEAEAVAASVFDPSGRKVWERPAITVPEQFVSAPDSSETGRAWRVRFARPAGKTMEDFYVELQGIPPFLSSTPGGLLRPVP